MRCFIDIVSNLTETIVYQDKFVKTNYTKKTIIAINPTRSEWIGRFPEGAGGVLMKDGTIVIGDGNALDHATICEMAGLDVRNEAFRLQLYLTGAYAEIWLNDEDVETPPPFDLIEQRVVEQYGETLVSITNKVKTAVHRFMGNVPVRAIPLNADQDAFSPQDQSFIQGIVESHYALIQSR